MIGVQDSQLRAHAAMVCAAGWTTFPSLRFCLLKAELGQQALLPAGEVGVRPHPRLVESVQKYDHGSSEISFRMLTCN